MHYNLHDAWEVCSGVVMELGMTYIDLVAK